MGSILPRLPIRRYLFAGLIAKKSLIFLELDFPRKKAQAEPLKRANQALSEKYKIEGFPTLIVLNGDGKELWRQVGYGGDSAKAVVGQIEKAISKK